MPTSQTLTVTVTDKKHNLVTDLNGYQEITIELKPSNMFFKK